MSEIEKRWNQLKKASKNRETLKQTIRYWKQYVPSEIVSMIGKMLRLSGHSHTRGHAQEGMK